MALKCEVIVYGLPDNTLTTDFYEAARRWEEYNSFHRWDAHTAPPSGTISIAPTAKITNLTRTI